MEPALFRRWPGLRGRIHHHPLLGGRTPVEPLALPGAPEGTVLVKRDELSCPLYGGNKPRKLEFVLGHALAHRCRRLVTTGGIGTHHGLATTILGRSAGLATTLVLVDQPLTDEVRHSLLLMEAWGAELVFGRDVKGTALHVSRVLARGAARGERPYLVATGGSSTRGNFGFVSAALELAEQVAAGRLPEPAEIWVAVGTGGTLSGLAAGLRLAGLESRMVGVLVTDILPPSRRSLARAATRAAAALRRIAPELPKLRVAPDDLELVVQHVGPGYGAPTPEAQAAVAGAAEAGLSLETTYTGKCFAALRARAEAGGLKTGPVLFWNTYNAVDVEASAPRPLDPKRLPPTLRRRLG
jgi:D-cysteine desulfhydrase